MADILLIANRTCPCPGVLDAVRARAAPDGRVLIVVPALNGRVKHYVSDTDEAVRPDDVVTAVWRLEDITERTTGAGQRMLVFTSRATYTNQDGDLLATNEETIIYLRVAS